MKKRIIFESWEARAVTTFRTNRPAANSACEYWGTPTRRLFAINAGIVLSTIVSVLQQPMAFPALGQLPTFCIKSYPWRKPLPTPLVNEQLPRVWSEKRSSLGGRSCCYRHFRPCLRLACSCTLGLDSAPPLSFHGILETAKENDLLLEHVNI